MRNSQTYCRNNSFFYSSKLRSIRTTGMEYSFSLKIYFDRELRSGQKGEWWGKGMGAGKWRVPGMGKILQRCG